MQNLSTGQEEDNRTGQASTLRRIKNGIEHVLWVVVFRKNEALMFLFGCIAVLLVFVQFLVFVTHKPRDPATSHWKRAYLGGKIVTAPALVYQHAKYRGFGMPVYENISDLSQYHFRDVSSVKVAKGVTLTLFSEPGWKGSEISIDHDATYIGDRFNDQSYSLAITIDPVVAHDLQEQVEVFRVGASLGLRGGACPAGVECEAGALMPAVAGSVYMARNRMMLEHLSPRLGCTVSHFTSPNGQRVYGMLPSRVHAVCVDEQFVFPAEPPGHTVPVPNPSLHRRVQVESVVAGPRVLRAHAVAGERQRQALLDLAAPLLAHSDSHVGRVAEFGREKAGSGWSRERERRGLGALLAGSERGKEGEVGRAVWALGDVLSLPADLADTLQVRCLGEGESEPLHHEWAPPALPASHPDASRNRLATALLLLSSAEAGGEIRVSTDGAGGSAGVAAAPGDAVLLYNLVAQGHARGQTDPLAAYSVSRVAAGEQCMAVVHFHNRLRFQDQYNAQHGDKHRQAPPKSRPHERPHALGKLPT